MLARILTGLIGGVLLLGALLHSFQAALAVAVLLHVLAAVELGRLDPKITRLGVGIYAVCGTLLLILLSFGLSKLLPLTHALPALMLCVLPLAALDLAAYDRTGESGHHWRLLQGLLCVTVPLSFLAPVASWPGEFPYLLLLLGASFGADVGGIFAGKLAGRTKLAPRLSPHKTWEGFCGGLLAAAAIWCAAAALWPLDWHLGGFSLSAQPQPLQYLLIALAAVVTALAGVVGDLTFSLFKRQAGIKDYGRLLPGHGGVLDRFDALLFCAPLVYAVALG